ncbi:MAG: 3-oxoacyl-ACP reductase FabG [Deltaproteobacteria bacterium]|nr:3-oxoacyl-ACP reductase FabG [Deltaproteobacteria bacterium]
MSLELEGRVAVVTGASRGIGKACALALGARGATVVVNFTANEAAAVEVANTIQNAGSKAIVKRFDVSNSEAVNAAMKEIVAECGGVDILVNNAGISINGLTLGAKDEDWQRALAVNLTGPFNCTRAALRPLMKAKQNGRIINLTSVVAESGSAGQAFYVAAKAGVIGLTKTWAREYASRGITANAVSPGFIDTDMTAADLPEARRGEVMASIPLGRVGAPEDVAAAVVFLAGPGAGYVTGQVLRVNGGLLM